MTDSQSSGFLSPIVTSDESELQNHRIHRKPVPNVEYSEAEAETTQKLVASVASNKPAVTHKSKEPTFFQIWWLVIVSCTVAVAMILAIAVVLYKMQYGPSPTLPYRISLNTIIAILVIIMRTCMLLVLAEGLGQLKWEYFRRRRPLHHLVVYDSATRGPWGCVDLILALRGRSLIATLGALVTILTLPIDAFTQQLIHYYPCNLKLTNDSTAVIPRANLYTETAGSIGSGIFGSTTAQAGAVVGAVFAPESVRLPFVCSTGECSFTGSYATLAYSADCDDVTNELQIVWLNPRNQSVVGPPGPSSDIGQILNSSLSSGLWAAGSVNQPVFSMSVDQKVSNTTAIVVEMILGAQSSGMDSGFTADYGTYYGSGCESDWQNQTWGCIGKGAARCTIRPTVQVYNASVIAGVLHEELLETHSDWYSGQELEGSANNYSAMADLSCVDETARNALRQRGLDVSTSRFIPYDVVISAVPHGMGSDTVGDFSQISNEQPSSAQTLSSEQLSLVPRTCIYELPNFALLSIYGFLDLYFRLQVIPPLVGMAPTRAGSLKGDSQALAILNNTQLNIGTINDTFAALAQALSIRMRQWNSNGTRDVNQAKTGETNIATTCLRIRWPWITYAVITVASTLIFFIAVAVQTETLGQSEFARGWVNSLLPLLNHGIDDVITNGTEEETDKDNINVMTAFAKKSTGYIARQNGSEPVNELQLLRERR